MKAVERTIAWFKSVGRPESQIKKIEDRLASLKGRHLGAIRREGLGGPRALNRNQKAPSGMAVIKHFANGVSERSAHTAMEGLTKPGHPAHEGFKKEVFRVIEANGKIPADYKNALIRDTAMLLRVCPEAGGLVTAMVTRGQPRGTFARRLGTRGNDAVGASYEIMGTAALCRRASAPSNGRHNAPTLSISPGDDRLVFGPKAYMNHRYAHDRKVSDRGRRTVEADAQLYKGGREIGIDFKHVRESGTRANSADLRKQLKAVAETIASGQYDEYHFVTNGKFANGFREAVDAVNDELVARDNTPIAYHEYVNSVGTDPHASGEA